jgi:hypothetical protein
MPCEADAIQKDASRQADIKDEEPAHSERAATVVNAIHG